MFRATAAQEVKHKNQRVGGLNPTPSCSVLVSLGKTVYMNWFLMGLTATQWCVNGWMNKLPVATMMVIEKQVESIKQLFFYVKSRINRGFKELTLSPYRFHYWQHIVASTGKVVFSFLYWKFSTSLSLWASEAAWLLPLFHSCYGDWKPDGLCQLSQSWRGWSLKISLLVWAPSYSIQTSVH